MTPEQKNHHQQQQKQEENCTVSTGATSIEFEIINI